MLKVIYLKNSLVLYISIIFCLIAFTLNGQAAVAVDNSTSNQGFDNLGLTTLGVAHEISSTTSNRVLYVGVSTSTIVLPVGAPANRVDTVTFELDSNPGVKFSLERVGSRISSDNLNTVEMFRLVAPPSGMGTIRINFVVLLPNPNPLNITNLLVNYAVGGAISFSGASQTSTLPPFFSQTGSNTSPTVSVTGGVSGDLVLDTVGVSPDARFIFLSTANIEQTRRWVVPPPAFGSFDIGAGSTEFVPSAPPFTVTMEWNLSDPDNWVIGAVLVRQFVISASPSSISGRVVNKFGRGVSRAFVDLTNNAGEKRRVLTNPFGYFRFNDVPSGETYIVSVKSKRGSFASQVVSVTNDVNELIFTAQP